jgi:hypothetical protein
MISIKNVNETYSRIFNIWHSLLLIEMTAAVTGGLQGLLVLSYSKYLLISASTVEGT